MFWSNLRARGWETRIEFKEENVLHLSYDSKKEGLLGHLSLTVLQVSI